MKINYLTQSDMTTETIIAKTVEVLGLEKKVVSNELPGCAKWWGEEEQTRVVYYGKYHREYHFDARDGIITLTDYWMKMSVDAITCHLVGKVVYADGEKAEAKRCLKALMSAAGANKAAIVAALNANYNFEKN